MANEKETLDDAIFNSFAYWTDRKSILTTRDLSTGYGPLYGALWQFRDVIYLMIDKHRDDLNLPRTKPLWSVQNTVVTKTSASFNVRWRGYRCEEDDPDEERPLKDVTPFMAMSATLLDNQVAVKLQCLPRGKEHTIMFPVFIERAVYTPLLRELIAVGLEIVDAECTANPEIALRPQTKLRSGKLVDKFCPCGPNAGHLFL